MLPTLTYGILSTLEDFTKKMQLPESIKKNLLDSYEKFNFCKTLCPEIHADPWLINKIELKLSEIEW